MIERILAAAPRGGAAARLRELRRALARAEDGERASTRCSRSCAISRAARKPFAERDYAELAAFARDRARPRRARAVGPRLRVGEAQGAALRVLRAGGAPLLSRGQGARRAVPRGRDALRHLDPREPRPPTWHPTCASSTSSTRAGALIGQFYLDNYARAGQAGRRVDGRRDQPPPRRRACPASGRVPDLQPVGAGRRQAGDVHARRSDHALPRVRPRPAPAADARRGRRRLRHPGRRMGRRRAAQPVHGELLLGVGRAVAR